MVTFIFIRIIICKKYRYVFISKHGERKFFNVVLNINSVEYVIFRHDMKHNLIMTIECCRGRGRAGYESYLHYFTLAESI